MTAVTGVGPSVVVTGVGGTRQPSPVLSCRKSVTVRFTTKIKA